MNIRVALVEDDRSVRLNLAQLISAAPGFDCVGACESAEAAILNLPATAPDVILLDIHLPGRSGIECVAELRELIPGVQVIMLTVEEDSERVFESLKAGATGYLVKHVGTDDILAAVRDVRRGGAPMSSHIARMVVTTFREPPPAPAVNPALSPRETEVLQFLARGLRSKEIADRLQISEGTINTHVRHIYEKLHVRSRAEAVARLSRWSKSPS